MGQFVKGQSGNPGGKQKGLAAAAREHLRSKVAEGEDPALALVAFYSEVLFNARNKIEHRMTAASWLADRGWGKAPIFAPIEEGDPLDRAEREATELAEEFDQHLDELAARRAQAQ